MSFLSPIVQNFESLLWGYLGVFLILSSGIYLSIRSGFVQIFGLFRCFKHFLNTLRGTHASAARGASPILVFFASLGGCIGIGNVVSIAVAIQMGGPGALVWVWLTAFLGMIIKYSEVYLGIRFRVANDSGSYDGGPMYFLRHAFPRLPILANIMALLMCIYGAEIYLFSVIKESFVHNFDFPPEAVVFLLLLLVLVTVVGGVKRVGAVNSWLVPIFILIFLAMVSYVIITNLGSLPALLGSVIRSAFTGHAAVGGFAGSTVLMAMSRGVSSACYSGDVGIGYSAIIFAETNVDEPQRQASLAIIGIFLDTIVVCTAVMMLVLVSGVWQDSQLIGAMLVQRALEKYFPYMHFFMPAFIFMLGFSTITSYMVAGIKCAKFLSPRYGQLVFILLASTAFCFFSFHDSSLAMSIMYSCGGLLIVINIPGILALRNHIKFDF